MSAPASHVDGREPAPTPLRAARANLLVKMEAFNPGGSHKARPARHIVARAVREGAIRPGGPRRILEKTGGNLGIGLAIAAGRLGIGVDLVIGLGFSPLKRALCAAYGARLVGVDRLRAGLTPKQVIAELLAEQPDLWHFTDQFANPANLVAHEIETGPELVAQLRAQGVDRSRPIVLVKGAGTGASLTGIGRRLRESFREVRIVAVEPEGCDLLAGRFVEHALEGIAVGVVPPFLDVDLVDEVVAVDLARARAGQRAMARDLGFYPGASTGASYAAAVARAEARPDAVVVTLAYDAGDYTLLGDLSMPHTDAPTQTDHRTREPA